MTAPTDPAERGAYRVTEAARYVRLPAPTLRSWLAGRGYPRAGATIQSAALIRPVSAQPLLLSFYNLIEAHVLHALRSEHGVAMRAVRQAIDYAEHSLGIDRLLLREDLQTNAGDVFLEHYGRLINLSASGQVAMRRLLHEQLRQVVWRDRFPVRLLLRITDQASAAVVAIDPSIAFGRPFVTRAGVTVETLADRVDAGESVTAIADDYDLTAADVEEAIVLHCQRAA